MVGGRWLNRDENTTRKKVGKKEIICKEENEKGNEDKESSKAK